MSEKESEHRARGSKGGKTRAERLTTEERQEIARQAAEARWGGKSIRATHAGDLVIAGRNINCVVLEDGRRVLSQESFLTAIGRAGKAKGGTGGEQFLMGLPPFLSAENLQPFISDELREKAAPISFRHLAGQKAYGYEATLLVQVCEVYLRARDADKILPTQAHIAQACDLLMRGFAMVGIIALVDEATGYQETRAKDELSKILEAYIAPELMPWTRMFPEEFFKQVYRIHNWEYKPGNPKRPGYVGHFINRHIYEHLPPGVLDQLRKLNPTTEKGYRKHKHFQFLSQETGNPHLDKHIATVTMLMRISDDKDDFERNFDRAFNRPTQERLPLVIDVLPEPSSDSQA